MRCIRANDSCELSEPPCVWYTRPSQRKATRSRPRRLRGRDDEAAARAVKLTSSLSLAHTYVSAWHASANCRERGGGLHTSEGSLVRKCMGRRDTSRFPRPRREPGQRDALWRSLPDKSQIFQLWCQGRARALLSLSLSYEAPSGTRPAPLHVISFLAGEKSSSAGQREPRRLGPSATFCACPVLRRATGGLGHDRVRPSSSRATLRSSAAADLVGCFFSQHTVNAGKPAHWTAGPWRGPYQEPTVAATARRAPTVTPSTCARHAPADRGRAHRLHTAAASAARRGHTVANCRAGQGGPLLGGTNGRCGPELDVGGREASPASRQRVERDAGHAQPRRVRHEWGVWIEGGGGGARGWRTGGTRMAGEGRMEGGGGPPAQFGCRGVGVGGPGAHARAAPQPPCATKAHPLARGASVGQPHHRPTRRGQHTV